MEISNVETVRLLDWEDLTESERESLDWDTEQSGAYFRHRGNAWSVAEFSLTTNASLQAMGWVGINFDSLFSGTIVKMPDWDEEEITVGWVYSGNEDSE